MKFSEIKHHPEKHQFTMDVDGHTALIDYTERDGKLYLVHSEVPIQLRGQGVGKVLVEKTFDYIQEKGWYAVPVCSFIRAVAKRNPNWSHVAS